MFSIYLGSSFNSGDETEFIRHVQTAERDLVMLAMGADESPYWAEFCDLAANVAVRERPKRFEYLCRSLTNLHAKSELLARIVDTGKPHAIRCLLEAGAKMNRLDASRRGRLKAALGNTFSEA